jgi:hypothetical protein
MSAASRRLTLYGHSYCSLCEAMHAQLLGLTGELGLERGAFRRTGPGAL